MKEEFAITKEVNEGTIKFIVKGQVNSINAPELEYEMEDALNAGQVNIVLNMTQVEYLSSIGVRVILKFYKKAKEEGGKLNIERPSETVRNVLGTAALYDMLLK